jgi:hypothetical protein
VVSDTTRGITGKALGIGRQQLLEREIVAIADREKERLGRELHDGLCQSLAGTAALSSALSRKLAASAQLDLAAPADEIARLLNEVIGEPRDLARGLDPFRLNPDGPVSGLETLAHNISNTYRAMGVSPTSKPGCRPDAAPLTEDHRRRRSDTTRSPKRSGRQQKHCRQSAAGRPVMG